MRDNNGVDVAQAQLALPNKLGIRILGALLARQCTNVQAANTHPFPCGLLFQKVDV